MMRLIDHMFLAGVLYCVCVRLYIYTRTYMYILYTIILKFIQLENWFSPPFASNHMIETILCAGTVVSSTIFLSINCTLYSYEIYIEK